MWWSVVNDNNHRPTPDIFAIRCSQALPLCQAQLLRSLLLDLAVTMGREETEFWRKYREDLDRQANIQANKRRRQDHAPREPEDHACHDWYIHNGNVHFARDRSVFTTYTPLGKLLARQPQLFLSAPIAGIGTVKIEVKPSPTATSTHVIPVTNVLHMPTAPCNGLSISLVEKKRPRKLGYGRPYWSIQTGRFS